MKTTFSGVRFMLIVGAVIFCLVSCTSTSFISRKYTSGIFVQNNHNIKHNTIKADTFGFTCSLIKQKLRLSHVNLFDSNSSSPLKLKKDSIIIKHKPGRDKLIIIKNSTNNSITHIDKNNKVIKKVDYETERLKGKKRITENCIAGSFFCLIPLFGFIISLTVFNQVKKYGKCFPSENIKRLKVWSFILVGCSILSILLFGYFAIIALQTVSSSSIPFGDLSSQFH